MQVEIQRKNNLKLRDFLMIAVMTFIAAVIAFSYLGSTNVPVSSVSKQDDVLFSTVIIDTEHHDVTQIWVYQGIGSASILLTSYQELNGSVFSSETLKLSNDNMYRWHIHELDRTSGRYIRLRYMARNVEIYEIAFANSDGDIRPIEIVGGNNNSDKLFDEQSLVPVNPDLMTGMYFDELYHAITALEFIRGDKAYEYTHPPLGKIIISWGIQLFGMNPFGWRVMSALFSVMLIPLFYLFIFGLTRSTVWSTLGALLFNVEGMRIVMGRIATLDTFAVFFILAAFALMYAFYNNFPKDKSRIISWTLPLALSGVLWGISVAVKWTGVYAGMGLFILFVITVVKWLIIRSKASNSKSLIQDKTVIARISSVIVICIICYLLIPFVIYLLSYIPFKEGLNTDSSLFSVMIDNQKDMYNYHSKLEADHPAGSKWFVWLFNAMPVYFYNGEQMLADGFTAKIFAWGNFAIWLTGLFITATILFDKVKITIDKYYKKQTVAQDKSFNSKILFLLVMYLSMLLPWALISRVSFMYHYYGCVPPLIALTILYFKQYWNHSIVNVAKDSRLRYMPIITNNGEVISSRILLVAYIFLALFAFVIFYPLFTGIPVQWIIYPQF